ERAEPDLPLCKACLLHHRPERRREVDQGHGQPARPPEPRRCPESAEGGRVRPPHARVGLAVALLATAALAAEPDFEAIGALPFRPPKPAPAFALPADRLLHPPDGTTDRADREPSRPVRPERPEVRPGAPGRAPAKALTARPRKRASLGLARGANRGA